MREKIEDILWNIKAFFAQPIIPTKTKEWVIEHDCSYNGKNNKGTYNYYWYSDFKTGYQVKVRRD